MIRRAFGVLRPRPTTGLTTRGVVAALTGTALALGLGLTAPDAPAEAAPQPSMTLVAATSTALAPDTYKRRVQRLVNRRRANHGLPRLRVAACADTVATEWSRFLAANNEFYHQPMTEVLDRCDATYAGETLGRGSMPPRRLVRMWMDSPGHRAVLLSPKPRRIGIGATRDGFDRWVVAANFLRF